MINLENYKAGWVSIAEIDVSNIEFQFRNNLAFEDIALSLKNEGQKFPVILFKKSDSPLQAISGFRRINAAKSLSWEKILAIVIPESDMSREEALRLNFIENLERKSLTNMDLIFACRKLHEQGKNNVEIGKLISRDEAMVRKYLKVAFAGEDIQKKVMAGEMAVRNIGKTSIGTRSDTVNKNENMYVKKIKNGLNISIKYRDKRDNPDAVIKFLSDIISRLKKKTTKK